MAAFQVRTLPALGTSSPSKKRPLPKSLDTVEGEYGGQTYVGGGGNYVASPQQAGLNLTGTSSSKPFAETSRSGAAGNSTPSTLPPLMKGSRLSVLSTTVADSCVSGGVAPSCGPAGGSAAVEGEDEEGRWRDRQEAWVERGKGGGERGEDDEEAFPFLAEDEMMLPDDRFEVRWRF